VSADRLYHLALVEDWERDAPADYATSTVGVSLDEQGFIHCSYAHQVRQTADLFYKGRDDVVLLEIDPDRLIAPVEVEDGFPHVYGALNRDAVVRISPFAAP
jgi:glutathione S-transferase